MSPKPTYEELEQKINELEKEAAQRKQIENALRKTEERLSQITEDFCSVPTFIINENFFITHWNRSCENITGILAKEVVGTRKQWKAFYSEERPVMADLIVNEASEEEMARFYGDKCQKSALIEGAYEAEDFFPNMGESGRWLFFTANPLRDHDGKIIGAIETLQDITDRKQAEKALEECAGKYRSLTETVVDVIYTLDSKGMFTYLSPAFERITGYAVEDFIGRSFTEIITPEYIDSTVEIFKRGLSGEPTPAYDVEFKHKDRGSLPVELHASTLLNADGTPTGRIGIARDITDRKRAEDKIKESLREKEVLLQEMHHRVKNNMQIISSLLNLQSEYIKDKESLEMFNESRNRIFSMASVHEKLYQSGDLTKIDFDGYIKSLSRNLLLTYSIKRRVIKMKTNCSDIFLDINNAVPCGLIINELISNSLKHAFPEDREGEITVDFHPDGDNRLILAVSDNGVGFAEDVDINNVKTLGLHLVRALVTQLKGTLEIKNDCGTAFKITFAP